MIFVLFCSFVLCLFYGYLSVDLEKRDADIRIIVIGGYVFMLTFVTTALIFALGWLWRVVWAVMT